MKGTVICPQSFCQELFFAGGGAETILRAWLSEFMTARCTVGLITEGKELCAGRRTWRRSGVGTITKNC